MVRGRLPCVSVDPENANPPATGWRAVKEGDQRGLAGSYAPPCGLVSQAEATAGRHRPMTGAPPEGAYVQHQLRRFKLGLSRP